MSASDSDYSIDWLASDDEDNDSELEPDCTKTQGKTTLPRNPSSGVIQVAQSRNGDKGEVNDKENMSSPGSSPSSCDSSEYGIDGGLSHMGRGDRSNYSQCPESPKGKSLKRTWSSVVLEQRERQLTPEQMEKDRLFAYKVRRATFGALIYVICRNSSGSKKEPLSPKWSLHPNRLN